MISYLREPDDEHPDPRAELDRHLGVGEWARPGSRLSRQNAVSEDGTPAWWKGDQEASDSFLRSMGVSFGPNGEVIR